MFVLKLSGIQKVINIIYKNRKRGKYRVMINYKLYTLLSKVFFKNLSSSTSYKKLLLSAFP